jgi:DNA-binding CsgD family transcriptional regulator
MSSTLAARWYGELSESAFGGALLNVAASRTVQHLGEAYHREIGRLIGSRSVGLYVLRDGRPHLLFSRQAAQGFLREYDARADVGDILIERLYDRRHAIDGFTELGQRVWHSSGSFELLRRWGYRHCMAGPLFVGGRVIGVIYTASPEQLDPYRPTLLERMDVLCRAGSIALTNMFEVGIEIAPCTDGEADRGLPDLAAESSSLAELPRRSREVAALVCEGRSNKEIARTLGLSAHTVKEYVGNLCKRMGVHNRTELAHRFGNER